MLATSATKCESSYKLADVSFGQALIAHLEFKVGHDRNQVDIAAAFADAVDRPLHLGRAFAHRRQRIDDRRLAVVVGVDSNRMIDDGLEFAHDAFHIPGQRAAVGVAQNDHFRAAANGGLQGFEGIGRIRFVAVEEMLGIVDARACRWL